MSISAWGALWISLIVAIVLAGFSVNSSPISKVTPHISTDVPQNIEDPVLIEDTHVDEINSDDPIQLADIIAQADEEKTKNIFSVCI